MSDVIKLSFTGDVMSYKAQNEAVKCGNAYDYTPVFERVKKLLSSSDYLCGNLETPITSSNDDLTYKSSFNTPASFLDSLKSVGFKFFSTANNHAMDRGVEGLISTVKELEKRSIDYSGTCISPEKKNRFFVKEIDSLKIAFISYTYGANSEHHGNVLPGDKSYMLNLLREQPVEIEYEYEPRPNVCVRAVNKILRKLKLKQADPNNGRQICVDTAAPSCVSNPNCNRLLDELKQQIGIARQQADIVVVCLHLGGQYNSYLGTYSKYVLNELDDLPFDLIVTNHPHCILPYKYRDSKFIAYSLGNFTFTPGNYWQIKGVFAEYNILLNIFVNKKTKSIERASFSLLTVVTNERGVSQTIPAYDLVNQENDCKKKKNLLRECKKAIYRFTGKKIKELLPEFDLSPN